MCLFKTHKSCYQAQQNFLMPIQEYDWLSQIVTFLFSGYL